MATMRTLVLVGFCGVVVLMIVNVHAQSDKTSTKTKRGLRFTVPEDWPIEEKDGVVAPIPIEEYVVRRFHGITERFVAVEQNLMAKIGDLNRLVELKDAQWSEKLGEVNAGIDSIHDEIRALTLELSKLSRVDSKIEPNDRSVDEMLDRMNNRINSLERHLGSLEFHLSTLEGRESAP